MQSEQSAARSRVSTSRAVRHHLAVVLVFLALGAVAGYLYSASVPARYTSTARVLVNPSVGNPFVPTPSSVRQDELTSLETEAQVARSDEVLGAVVALDPTLTLGKLKKGVAVTIPPNTQILEMSYTAGDPAGTQQVADLVAQAYLDNRTRRSEEVNAARIARVEQRTQSVVDDLRAATAAAQTNNDAEKLFQQELADALRNELVSLRTQRTALENSETPSGVVIAPAAAGKSAGSLTVTVLPVALTLAGLLLGSLIAVALERARGRIRSASDVEAIGVPVVANVPAAALGDRLLHRGRTAAVDTTIRRLRATMLDLEPRPDVIAIAPAGSGRSDAEVSEAVAESFAKAGHRVVLVRTDGAPAKNGLGVDDRGLAQALLYERLNVVELLQPTVEPLLSLLSDGGFTAQSRELLVADRVRAVLSPLIEEGHLVVIQSPGLDSADGEAFLGAADLGLVVVTVGRTRPRAVEQVATLLRTKEAQLAALVVGRTGVSSRSRHTSDDSDLEVSKPAAAVRTQETRARQ
jgi:succinoglycan biosynthesis transport protein ExoP